MRKSQRIHARQSHSCFLSSSVWRCPVMPRPPPLWSGTLLLKPALQTLISAPKRLVRSQLFKNRFFPTWSSLWSRAIRRIPYRYFSFQTGVTHAASSGHVTSDDKPRRFSQQYLFHSLHLVILLPSVCLPCCPPSGALLFWVFEVGFGWGQCSSESQRRYELLSS